MARGRPVGSPARQNIIEILYHMGSAHGYQIYKVYKEIYPQITLRAIYYHLKKGVSIGELEVEDIKKEGGEYSWGTEAEKTYYKLGPQANPRNDPRVKMYLDTKKK